MVEDRLFPVVKLYDFLLLGGNQGNVAAGLLINLLVVDIHVRETVVEEVTQDSGGLGILREEQSRSFVFRDSLPGTLPLFNQ